MLGQGTLRLGTAVLVAYLMESSVRVQKQSAAEGGSRMPDFLLAHIPSYMYNNTMVDVSATTAARHVLSYSKYPTACPLIL